MLLLGQTKISVLKYVNTFWWDCVSARSYKEYSYVASVNLEFGTILVGRLDKPRVVFLLRYNRAFFFKSSRSTAIDLGLSY